MSLEVVNAENQTVTTETVAPVATEKKEYKKALSVKFFSVESFKRIIGTTALEVKFNTVKKKLSVLDIDANEQNKRQQFYYCQQGIDFAKPMAFLIPDGIVEEACLVNVKNESPLITKLAL